MRALFMRGKFTAADAQAAALTLAAYTIGLIPFVLMRSVVATFLARRTPRRRSRPRSPPSAVNVALKIVLLYTTDLAQVGLALATSVGAWINFGLMLWFGKRAGFIAFDARFLARRRQSSRSRARCSPQRCGSRSGRCWLTAGLPACTAFWRCCCSRRSARWSMAAPCLGLFGKAWLATLFRAPKTVTPSSAPPAPE